MKVSNFTDLKNLIKLCRELGVENIEIDGIKLALSAAYTPKNKSKGFRPEMDIPEAGLKVPVYGGFTGNPVPPIASTTGSVEVQMTPQQLVQEVIKTDALSDEDLLFYSVSGQLDEHGKVKGS